MAIINYTDQLKYAGKGYLDAKMMPVNTVDDLKSISLTQRFEGLTITVLNNGKPQDYWLVGGITNNNWVPKTVAGDYSELRLVLEDGFLKLMDGDKQLGDSVDFNNFFPETPDGPNTPIETYIVSVEYTTTNNEGLSGIFMCFTYNDGTHKYLDMSQFLSKTYESGSGIVIDGNVISIDEAVLGRIEALEASIENINSELGNKADAEYVAGLGEAIANETSQRTEAVTQINDRIGKLAEALDTEKSLREEEDTKHKNAIESLQVRLNNLNSNLEKSNVDIATNTSEIEILKERVNALSAASEGSTPDGETIGITNDDAKALYVKILEKEGNILKKDTNNSGESGLYASIPVFLEDDELL